MRTKQCKECLQILPLENFAIERTNKDGKRGKCKECTRKINAKYVRKKRLQQKLEVLVGDNLGQCKNLGFPYVLGRMPW